MELADVIPAAMRIMLNEVTKARISLELEQSPRRLGTNPVFERRRSALSHKPLQAFRDDEYY